MNSKILLVISRNTFTFLTFGWSFLNVQISCYHYLQAVFIEHVKFHQNIYFPNKNKAKTTETLL